MNSQTETHNDAAIQSLETYRELRRRLESQAVKTMKAFNAAKVYDMTGEEAPKELIDEAVGELWQLQELEKAVQPFTDLGFPAPLYDRPDLNERITPLSGDPWADWRSAPNVVKSNSDRGRKGGF